MEFQEGYWIYLCLQPYRQKSIAMRKNLKLPPRFFGTFQILKNIGTVAYKLNLTTEARIHPVFHVSCLKKKLGQQSTPLPTLPPEDLNGEIRPEPEAILERRMIKKNHIALTEVLIQ